MNQFGNGGMAAWVVCFIEAKGPSGWEVYQWKLAAIEQIDATFSSDWWE